MESRPELTNSLDSRTFREYYYLKEEMAAFCRENHLPASGSKQELTERIACFLDTGRVQQTAAKRTPARKPAPSEITRESIIEDGFVCTAGKASLKTDLSARKNTARFSGKRSETAFPSTFSSSSG